MFKKFVVLNMKKLNKLKNISRELAKEILFLLILKNVMIVMKNAFIGLDRVNVNETNFGWYYLFKSFFYENKYFK